MNTTQLKATLSSIADTVGKNRAGNYVLRRGFFYRHGKTAELFTEQVSTYLTDAGVRFQVVDKGEHNAPFRGGASTARNSHWWVELKIER